MFRDILFNMLEDMSAYHRDKETLLTIHINERLNKSLQTYYKEISKSLDYLSNRNELSILKKMK